MFWSTRHFQTIFIYSLRFKSKSKLIPYYETLEMSLALVRVRQSQSWSERQIRVHVLFCQKGYILFGFVVVLTTMKRKCCSLAENYT